MNMIENSIGLLATVLAFIFFGALCCSSDSTSQTKTPPKRKNTSNTRNTHHSYPSYCECPSCGAPYYDGYCEECGYPDINQGWIGENY